MPKTYLVEHLSLTHLAHSYHFSIAESNLISSVKKSLKCVTFNSLFGSGPTKNWRVCATDYNRTHCTHLSYNIQQQQQQQAFFPKQVGVG